MEKREFCSQISFSTPWGGRAAMEDRSKEGEGQASKGRATHVFTGSKWGLPRTRLLFFSLSGVGHEGGVFGLKGTSGRLG